MNHTPTPWNIESGITRNWILYDQSGGRTVGLIGFIPSSNCNEIPDEEKRANATFIVTACNEYDENKRKADVHEDLVFAVRYALKHAQAEVLKSKLREALAKAGVKP